MYKVNFNSYCGMSDYPAHFDTQEEARSYIAERIVRIRKRFKMTTLKRGTQWEVLEPENAVMVPDACGTMSLEHITFKCRECGCKHDSTQDALYCCAWDDDGNDEA